MRSEVLVRLRAPLSASALCLVAILSMAAGEGSDVEHRFPIVFHVAEDPRRQPVVSLDWLDAQLSRANQIFAPAGVQFERRAVRSIPALHSELETRSDRHALGGFIEDGVINAFIVRRLADVDEPGRERRGVHWRPAGLPGAHFVIVSAIAMDTVLAHELGHFFGNREHPDTPGNIMSYTAGEGIPFFDRKQLERIRRFARKFERSGELSSVR